jgi:ligand-binding sensor domain-containing protein
MKVKAFFLLIVLALSIPVQAQVFNWKNYTDMKNVTSVVPSDNKIWAATSGGAFSYEPATGTYKKLHKVDGFSGTRLTSAAVDGFGRIWFGSSTGRIDVYNPQTNTFIAILDIFSLSLQQKGINDILVSGDSVFLATDFGISVITASTLLFADSYTRFGSLNSNLKVHNIYKSDRIYASLDNGIAVQKPGAVNLSSPDSWEVYPVLHNNVPRKVKYVVEYAGNILAATETGIFSLQGNMFTQFLLEGSDIKMMQVSDGNLYISSGNSLLNYNGEISQILFSNRTYSNVLFFNDELYAASNDGIIKIQQGQIAEVIKPDAPNANLFAAMTVDSKGNLWTASARDPAGQGFYLLNNDTWTNYNTATNPEILINGYFTAFSSNEEVYLGSWGRGFLRIRNGVMQSFNYTNTPLRGITQNPEYIVVGGLAKDSKNNLWILNYGTITRENLSMLTPDSTWHHFKVASMQDLYLDENFGLNIDQNNTKWFFSRSTNRPGVFYFNENNTLSNSADDRSGYITELNERVLSMAVDKRGDVWVGTGLGVNIISNTSAVLSSSNPQFRISSVFSLRQYSINSIAVDPLNRKWIGTNQGLLLVNSDGSQLISSFDSRNTPLLSDEIRSIVVDERSGIVYVGTDEGLVSFETVAKKPLDAFEDLNIYPNPLKISNNFNGLVTIDGLIKDTEIKILNVNGRVIQEFSSPGGRVAYWDGKNIEGEFVSSGIYFIVASDKDGDNVKTGKIAVLKE